MASPIGFEPTTYCLGGNCSIQLSYEDKKDYLKKQKLITKHKNEYLAK